MFVSSPLLRNTLRLGSIASWLDKCRHYVNDKSLLDFDACMAFEKEFQSHVKPLEEDVKGWGVSCITEFLSVAVA